MPRSTVSSLTMIVLRILTTESVYFLQKLKPYSIEGVQNVSFYTVQNFLIHRRGNHQLVTFTSKSKKSFCVMDGIARVDPGIPWQSCRFCKLRLQPLERPEDLHLNALPKFTGLLIEQNTVKDRLFPCANNFFALFCIIRDGPCERLTIVSSRAREPWYICMI